MHFALPTKNNTPMYKPRTSRMPIIRRSRVQFLVLCTLVIGTLYYFFSKIGGGEASAPPGTPPVVVVTVVEPGPYSRQYLDNIKQNRIEYAKKHGYKTFFPPATDYFLADSPASWAKIPAMRHAVTSFPHTKYFWFLDQNALIMNPELTIENHIMNPKRMDELMIKDRSVVPPDSVIKTFAHLKGDQIHLALSQDKDGLAPSSFVVRNGDWAKFFLETWFDPLYRSYNFQKAETHALEHIVQWHPTILSKMALIPQRILNSYSRNVGTGAGKNDLYKDGDFVIYFKGCNQEGAPKCETEAEPYMKQWKTIFNAQR